MLKIYVKGKNQVNVGYYPKHRKWCVSKRLFNEATGEYSLESNDVSKEIAEETVKSLENDGYILAVNEGWD